MANVQTAAAPAAAPVPTVSGAVTVDWGDWAAQALAAETPIIEAAAQAGISTALGAIPFGSVISSFIGPTVVNQYVAQGLTALEGVLAPEKLTIAPSNALETYVANAINANEPALAAFLGAQLGPMISAAIAKLGL